MLLRTEKNKSYVTINKDFLNDKRLSFRAKGIMAYCVARYDDIEFHVTHLQEIGTEGRDAILSAIKELIEAGYVIRKQSTSKGKFEKGSYEIKESIDKNQILEI